MITTDEKVNSNLSYVNKDFATIYPELVSLVGNLTNRWDPENSNESDPGNVLLKVMASIADKNNYAIDKAILEAYMPSATQDISMRRLCEMVGYSMGYYKSAQCNISFKYTNDIPTGTIYTLPRFTTVVSNEDNSIFYTLLENCSLANKNEVVSVKAIEGTFSTLSVGNSNTLTLENIDTNNRVYFGSSQVAENGVFVMNVDYENYDEWEKVDNLNIIAPNTKVYKFGYDSEVGYPYIEFPNDIDNLIGAGISISYVLTSGVGGNVSAGVLTQLTSDTDINTEYLQISNASSTSNGKDPETIDEAYNNYKKTIGTFNTLVTTRDYANALYNLDDGYGKEAVSNALVTDRRTDHNHAFEISTYGTYGKTIVQTGDGEMSPYVLGLYPLKPYLKSSYKSYLPNYAIASSFKPLKKDANNGEIKDTDLITSGLEDDKCIVHDYLTLHKDCSGKEDDIYCYKNYISIDCQMFTYSKVGIAAQYEIRNNVLKALSDNFNSRLVDFGEDITLDEISDVITNADSRISSITLGTPTYSTNYMYANGEEGSLLEDEDELAKVISRNVISGRISLFSYDNMFAWKFGQTELDITKDILGVSTDLQINVINNGLDYVLQPNEVIQFTRPLIQDIKTFPAGVRYKLTTSSTVTIPAKTDYKLLSGQSLSLEYTDEEGETITEVYGENSIIKSSVSITTSDSYSTLTGSNTIVERGYNPSTLKGTSVPMYWIRNNSTNTLFPASSTDLTQSVILEEGEQFIYSDSALNTIYQLGAGTMISRTRTSTAEVFDSWDIHTKEVSLSSIYENGYDAIGSDQWVYKQLTDDCYVELQKLETLSFGEGQEVIVENGWTSSAPNSIHHTFKALTSNSLAVSIKEGTTTIKTLSNNAFDCWNIRTRLDLNAGPSTPQALTSASNSGSISGKQQSISIIHGDNTTTTYTGGNKKNFIFSVDINCAGTGDTPIDLKLTNLATGKTYYDIDFCIYNKEDCTVTETKAYSQSEVVGATALSTLVIAGNDTIDADTLVVKKDNTTLTLGTDYTFANRTITFVGEVAKNCTIKVTHNGTTNGTLDPSDTMVIPFNTTKTVVLPLDIKKFNTTDAPSQDGEYTPSVEYTPYATYILPTYLLKTSGSTTVTLTGDGVKFKQYNTSNSPSTTLTLSTGGLYNVEVIANWLAEYATLSLLNSSRPWEYEDIVATYTIETGQTGAITILSSGQKINSITSITKGGTAISSSNYSIDSDGTGITFTQGTISVGDVITITFDGSLNVNDDECLVTSDTDNNNGRYKWEYTGSPISGGAWTRVQNNPTYEKITLTNANPSTANPCSLTLLPLKKIDGINEYLGNVDAEKVLDDIKSLENGRATFNYTGDVDNDTAIEVADLSSPKAFYDVNNVMNGAVISQLDLDTSEIYVAKSSQI